jgi:hypothetical protein
MVTGPVEFVPFLPGHGGVVVTGPVLEVVIELVLDDEVVVVLDGIGVGDEVGGVDEEVGLGHMPSRAFLASAARSFPAHRCSQQLDAKEMASEHLQKPVDISVRSADACFRYGGRRTRKVAERATAMRESTGHARLL